MDGVLINARDWHYRALNEALNHFGYKISMASHLSTFDGLPTSKKLEILSTHFGLPKALHQFINKLKQKYTIRESYLNCNPTFNHQKALSTLSDKYKIAVCSNSIKSTIDTLMELSALEDYLDLVISNEDVNLPKPNPEMYLLAMKNFKLMPKECLIVEDNDHGVKAALASGAHLLRVTSPDDVSLERIEKRIQEIES